MLVTLDFCSINLRRVLRKRRLYLSFTYRAIWESWFMKLLREWISFSTWIYWWAQYSRSTLYGLYSCDSSWWGVSADSCLCLLHLRSKSTFPIGFRGRSFPWPRLPSLLLWILFARAPLLREQQGWNMVWYSGAHVV